MAQQSRPSMRSSLLLLVASAAPAAVASMAPRSAFVMSSRTKLRFSTSLGAATEDHSHKVLADAGVAKLTNTPVRVRAAATAPPAPVLAAAPSPPTLPSVRAASAPPPRKVAEDSDGTSLFILDGAAGDGTGVVGSIGSTFAPSLPGALTNSGPALAAIAKATVSNRQGREAAMAIVRRLSVRGNRHYDYVVKVGKEFAVIQRTKGSGEMPLEVDVKANTLKNFEEALVSRAKRHIVEKCEAPAISGSPPDRECVEAVGSYLETLDAVSAPTPPPSGGGAGTTAGAPSAAAVTSYLDEMSTGGAPPPPMPYAPPPPRPAASTPKPPPGQANYLDAISEACEAEEPTEECDRAVMSYLDSLSSAAVPPPLSPVAPVSEHPPVPRMNAYLDNMDEAAAITSYLDAVADGERDMAVAAAEASAERVGAMPYLDAMHDACDVDEPDERCDDAVVSYLDALSHGTAAPPPMEGPGMMSYLDSVGAGGGGVLPPAAASGAGPGTTSYLDSVSAGGAAAPAASTPAGGAAGAVVVEAPAEAPPPPPAAPVEAAAAPSSTTSGSYLDALSPGTSTLKHPKPTAPARPAGGTGMPSYLDQMSAASAEVDAVFSSLK